MVNNHLIASRGSQAQGAIYQFVDTVIDDGAWEYLLEDVETDGKTFQHVDFITEATVNAPTAVSFVGGEAGTSSAMPLLIILVGLLMGCGWMLNGRCS